MAALSPPVSLGEGIRGVNADPQHKQDLLSKYMEANEEYVEEWFNHFDAIQQRQKSWNITLEAPEPSDVKLQGLVNNFLKIISQNDFQNIKGFSLILPYPMSSLPTWGNIYILNYNLYLLLLGFSMFGPIPSFYRSSTDERTDGPLGIKNSVLGLTEIEFPFKQLPCRQR